MKKKPFFINQIALQNSENVKASYLLFGIGSVLAIASAGLITTGVCINNKAMRIRAVCNEAADLIEELDNIWLSQQN